jgi:hypothetical protein
MMRKPNVLDRLQRRRNSCFAVSIRDLQRRDRNSPVRLALGMLAVTMMAASSGLVLGA